ncbi:MAG: hypothetical protein Crog4KO_09890 [Crocinitomicaceae bacterium]
MSGDERKRMCAICRENVHDVSQLDLKTVSEKYVNSGKCVQMSTDQVQFFQFLRSIPKIAGLSAALSLFPFADARAQDQDSNEEICIIYGKVHSNVNSNRTIFVIIEGQTFETESDDFGSFKLTVPKGQKIEKSNVKQLQDKTLKKDFISIKKARIPDQRFTIGTPSF